MILGEGCQTVNLRRGTRPTQLTQKLQYSFGGGRVIGQMDAESTTSGSSEEPTSANTRIINTDEPQFVGLERWELDTDEQNLLTWPSRELQFDDGTHSPMGSSSSTTACSAPALKKPASTALARLLEGSDSDVRAQPTTTSGPFAKYGLSEGAVDSVGSGVGPGSSTTETDDTRSHPSNLDYDSDSSSDAIDALIRKGAELVTTHRSGGSRFTSSTTTPTSLPADCNTAQKFNTHTNVTDPPEQQTNSVDNTSSNRTNCTHHTTTCPTASIAVTSTSKKADGNSPTPPTMPPPTPQFSPPLPHSSTVVTAASTSSFWHTTTSQSDDNQNRQNDNQSVLSVWNTQKPTSPTHTLTTAEVTTQPTECSIEDHPPAPNSITPIPAMPTVTSMTHIPAITALTHSNDAPAPTPTPATSNTLKDGWRGSLWSTCQLSEAAPKPEQHHHSPSKISNQHQKHHSSKQAEVWMSSSNGQQQSSSKHASWEQPLVGQETEGKDSGIDDKCQPHTSDEESAPNGSSSTGSERDCEVNRLLANTRAHMLASQTQRLHKRRTRVMQLEKLVAAKATTPLLITTTEREGHIQQQGELANATQSCTQEARESRTYHRLQDVKEALQYGIVSNNDTTATLNQAQTNELQLIRQRRGSSGSSRRRSQSMTSGNTREYTPELAKVESDTMKQFLAMNVSVQQLQQELIQTNFKNEELNQKLHNMERHHSEVALGFEQRELTTQNKLKHSTKQVNKLQRSLELQLQPIVEMYEKNIATLQKRIHELEVENDSILVHPNSSLLAINQLSSCRTEQAHEKRCAQLEKKLKDVLTKLCTIQTENMQLKKKERLVVFQQQLTKDGNKKVQDLEKRLALCNEHNMDLNKTIHSQQSELHLLKELNRTLVDTEGSLHQKIDTLVQQMSSFTGQANPLNLSPADLPFNKNKHNSNRHPIAPTTTHPRSHSTTTLQQPPLRSKARYRSFSATPAPTTTAELHHSSGGGWHIPSSAVRGHCNRGPTRFNTTNLTRNHTYSTAEREAARRRRQSTYQELLYEYNSKSDCKCTEGSSKREPQESNPHSDKPNHTSSATTTPDNLHGQLSEHTGNSVKYCTQATSYMKSLGFDTHTIQTLLQNLKEGLQVRIDSLTQQESSPNLTTTEFRTFCCRSKQHLGKLLGSLTALAKQISEMQHQLLHAVVREKEMATVLVSLQGV